ncbi:tetratricopeptide repeat protein [Chitinophaga sp. RAB17]|uniref:tetratricopeptide repeat protein n=1 Tax=Chitinophaga sp. RAB17 TaxID=3233049 RepID=UPI003F9207FF
MKLHAGMMAFLLMVNLQTLTAQKEGQPLTDSLLSALRGMREDSTKVKCLLNLSENYYAVNNPDECAAYAGKGVLLSEKLHWQSGIAQSYKTMGIAASMKQDYAKAIAYSLKGLKVAEELNDYNIRKKLLRNIGSYYHIMKDTTNHTKYRQLWLQLCTDHKIKKDISEVYLSWGNDFTFDGDMNKCIVYWLQTLKINDEIGDHSNPDVLGNLAQAYLNLHNGPTGRQYFSRLVTQSEANKDTLWVGKAMMGVGRAYSEENNHYKEIETYTKALKVFQQVDDKYWIAAALNAIANTYLAIDVYDKAMDYQLRALKVSELVNDTYIFPAVLNDLTLIYEKTGDYEKALQYLLLAKDRLEKNDNKLFLADALSNIGTIYRDKGDDVKAMEFLQKTLHIYQDLNSKDGLAIALNELGLTYTDLKKFPEALKAHFEALNINKQLGDQKLMSTNFGNIGNTYLSMVQENNQASLPDSLAKLTKKTLLNRSIDNLQQSVALASALGLLSNLLHDYESLATAHELNGNYKAALESYQKKTMYHDSLFSTEKIKTITSLGLKYDFDKKEIATKAAGEKQLALTEARNNSRLGIGVITAAALLLLITGSFRLRMRKKKQEHQLNQILLQQEAFKARLDTHFVSHSITAVNEFIASNDKAAADNYLMRFGRLIRNVLKNSFEKTVTLKEDLQFLEDYYHLVQLKYPPGHIKYQLNIDRSVDPSNILVPPMVFQVLVENALHHGFTKDHGGTLQVTVQQHNDRMVCTVEDDGIGRKKSQEKRDPQRISYGLQLVEKLITFWKPDYGNTSFEIIDLSDQQGNPTGTKAIFSFPVNA